jgi:flagellar hook-basal body complex protein FliE
MGSLITLVFPPTSFDRGFSSTLHKATTDFSEALVVADKTTRHHIQNDSNLD